MKFLFHQNQLKLNSIPSCFRIQTRGFANYTGYHTHMFHSLINVTISLLRTKSQASDRTTGPLVALSVGNFCTFSILKAKSAEGKLVCFIYMYIFNRK